MIAAARDLNGMFRFALTRISFQPFLDLLGQPDGIPLFAHAGIFGEVFFKGFPAFPAPLPSF